MNPVTSALEEAQRALLESSSEQSAAVLRAAQKLAALAWLVDFFRFYRALGFFADTPQLSDSDLALRWMERVNEDAKRGPVPAWCEPDCPDCEAWLLMADRKRVWAGDLERDVGAGNECYVQFLSDLAAISRGLFAPADVIESWSEHATETLDYGDHITVEFGRVHVFFSCNGEPFYFEPSCCGDWLDISAPIKAANQALEPTGYRFEQLEASDISCVVLLSAPEKKRILRERRVTQPMMGADYSPANPNFDPFEDRDLFDEHDPFAD